MRCRSVLLLLAVAAVCGCSRQDTERLGRIARFLEERGHQAIDESQKQLGASWANNDAQLAARVRQRLQADKNLADSEIAVTAKEGRIELTGQIRERSQQLRALDLARSTVGVEKVQESLQIQKAAATGKQTTKAGP